MATLDKKASQMTASFKVADEDPSYASPQRSVYLEAQGRMKKNHTFRMQSAQRRLDEENRRLLYRLMFTSPSYPRAEM